MASAERLLRFAMVGVAGAVIHIGAFEIIRRLTGAGYAPSWLGSFAIAATATWAMNRSFTFAAARERATAGEWLRYLLIAGLGALAHFMVFRASIAWVDIVQIYPALGIVPGSLASLCVTYLGSSLFVFASARNNP